jgi:hypothetical protein
VALESWRSNRGARIVALGGLIDRTGILGRDYCHLLLTGNVIYLAAGMFDD